MTNHTHSREWKDDLRLQLEELIDTFVVEGVRQEDIFDAIRDQLPGLRDALARDPDPAEDSSGGILDEPSNDWPSAISGKD